MKEENKIQIRVQSKTERRMMEDLDVHMMTEWDVKKITRTLCWLLLLVGSLIYYFFATENSGEEVNKAAETQELSQISRPSEKQIAIPVTKKLPIENKGLADKPEKELLKKPVKKQNAQLVKSAPIIIKNNKHIKRGLLAERIINKEPSGAVNLPLVVNKEKAVGLIYFTEIIDMKGSSIYHEWLINNKVIYKKKVNILGNRWRISTRKLFSYTATGQWQVRVVNDKGDMLHKIDFLVIK